MEQITQRVRPAPLDLGMIQDSNLEHEHPKRTRHRNHQSENKNNKQQPEKDDHQTTLEILRVKKDPLPLQMSKISLSIANHTQQHKPPKNYLKRIGKMKSRNKMKKTQQEKQQQRDTAHKPLTRRKPAPTVNLSNYFRQEIVFKKSNLYQFRPRMRNIKTKVTSSTPRVVYSARRYDHSTTASTTPSGAYTRRIFTRPQTARERIHMKKNNAHTSKHFKGKSYVHRYNFENKKKVLRSGSSGSLSLSRQLSQMRNMTNRHAGLYGAASSRRSIASARNITSRYKKKGNNDGKKASAHYM